MISEETKQRFDAWWKNERADRPMLRLIAWKEEGERGETVDLRQFVKDDSSYHIDPRYVVNDAKNFCSLCHFYWEAFPYVNLNMGPGSMAAYLASEPLYSKDTVWYREVPGEISDLQIGFERSTPFWRQHLELVKEAVALAGDMEVSVPDIMENIDVLSAIRGPQQFCFDLIDSPAEVRRLAEIVSRDYMKYYDAMYDAVKAKDGSCCYTAFSVWGRGKTAKLQCDSACLISPELYREFVLPGLRKQTREIPYTLYHLDGKGAVIHEPAILELEELNALQWEPGAGEADCGNEKWYPIYDKAKDAGKALWLSFHDGTVEDWIASSKKIARRYGNRGLYFHYPIVTKQQAREIMRSFG